MLTSVSPILTNFQYSYSLIRSIAFLWMFLISFFTYSNTFIFNDNCRDAYNEILSLRFKKATKLLEEEKAANKENLVPVFLENYIDFFKIIISEEEDLFEQLEDNKSQRMSAIKKDGDKSSPYYLYMQAEMHLQWAFSRLKFQEYATAAWEVYKAYNLLEENQEQFPDFMANKKSLGLLHALIGTIPDKYKWASNMIGLKGSIEGGVGELVSLMQYAKTHDFIFEEETRILYAFLLLYLKNDEAKSWSIINSDKFNTGTNLLNNFVAALIAHKTKRNDQAITILSNRPSSDDYYPFYYLDYLMGISKLYKLDESASKYLKQFIDNFRGRLYIGEAYQKLAWNELLKGNTAGYHEYMQKCLEYAEHDSEVDKEAIREAEEGPTPDVALLKARLLFDGGYYDKALHAIKGKSTGDFKHIKHQIELSYRAARIFHEQEKWESAIKYYKLTIKNGKDYSYYFAANSALQLGYICEEKGDYQQAEAFFKEAMTYKDHEYKNGIDQKAKAGLDRIKNKS